VYVGPKISVVCIKQLQKSFREPHTPFAIVFVVEEVLGTQVDQTSKIGADNDVTLKTN
jgi:hypothetical protein